MKKKITNSKKRAAALRNKLIIKLARQAASKKHTGEGAMRNIAAPIIQKTAGVISSTDVLKKCQKVLEKTWPNYKTEFKAADYVRVCGGTKPRILKILENSSNHGPFELDHQIFTVNNTLANERGFSLSNGQKFKGVYFISADALAKMPKKIPVLKTLLWDNNHLRIDQKTRAKINAISRGGKK